MKERDATVVVVVVTRANKNDQIAAMASNVCLTSLLLHTT